MLTDALKKQIQGAYSQFLENKGLTARYGQKLMIAEIAKTLGSIGLDDENHREIVERAGGHICVVEAGTGTGKTIAYLLAAIVMAKPLGKKLVVSTATVALQEQIVTISFKVDLIHSWISDRDAIPDERAFPAPPS